ncbi:MAG: hypothetical protein ACQEXB_04870 [Bacillota bacterium]
MKTSQYSLESILGVIVRARKQQGPHDADQFSTLLVHKEILGKTWGRFETSEKVSDGSPASFLDIINKRVALSRIDLLLGQPFGIVLKSL